MFSLSNLQYVKYTKTKYRKPQNDGNTGKKLQAKNPIKNGKQETLISCEQHAHWIVFILARVNYFCGLQETCVGYKIKSALFRQIVLRKSTGAWVTFLTLRFAFFTRE